MDTDILDTRISINLTPSEAYQFITKLCRDDAFRDRLQTNPADVLAEHHIYIPTTKVHDIITLPTKAELQHALDQFTNHGVIDLGLLFSPTGWPVMLFWWLYMTPAKPPRGQEGDVAHVQSR